MAAIETLAHREGPHGHDAWMATQSHGRTRFLNATRVIAHLQRLSRSRVRALGGGGIRTRVLRSRNRPSPSAADIRLSGVALLPAGSATP